MRAEAEVIIALLERKLLALRDSRTQGGGQEQREAEQRRAAQGVEGPSAGQRGAEGEGGAVRSCDSCGAVGVKLRVCSGCRQARYCSQECQARAWPAHRGACRAAQQAQQGQP